MIPKQKNENFSNNPDKIIVRLYIQSAGQPIFNNKPTQERRNKLKCLIIIIFYFYTFRRLLNRLEANPKSGSFLSTPPPPLWYVPPKKPSFLLTSTIFEESI